MNRFHRLLQDYNERGSAERPAIEKQLWDAFGVERAVFILDMAGFSTQTQKHGIVHYMAKIHAMRSTVAPMIEKHGGTVIKFEADNCYATFPDVTSATRTGIAVNRWYQALNMVTSDDRDIHLSCGIDFGKILVVEPRDFFGDPVNLASKLGEDVAERGEVLVTQRAWDTIDASAGLTARPVQYSVSGLELHVQRVDVR